jgi:putative transposase
MRCLTNDFKPDAIFHIYNHAIDDYDLFYDDEDYDYFLSIFRKNIKKVPASVYAYCLMPNHYHFLIRQDSDIEIFRLFNYSFISYAKHFNHKYSRSGPIFSSPLQHIKVEDRSYLLQLCKYIHLNPVRMELVDKPENWIYSNYNDLFSGHDKTLSIENIFKKLTINPIWYTSYINSPFNHIKNRDLINQVYGW